MSSEAPLLAPPTPKIVADTRTIRRPRRVASAHATLAAHGAPLVWLTGGALATALAMIVGLLALIFYHGLQTFWPARITQLHVESETGKTTIMLGEVARSELYSPDSAMLEKLKQQLPELYQKAQQELAQNGNRLERTLIWTGRTEKLEFAGSRAVWVNQFAISSSEYPPWAIVVERFDGGRSYGTPSAFLIDTKETASVPADVWKEYQQYHDDALDRMRRSTAFNRDERGAIDRRQRAARLAVTSATLELDDLRRSRPEDQLAIDRATAELSRRNQELDEVNRLASEQKADIDRQIKQLEHENARYAIRLQDATGQTMDLELGNIVRAYPANQLSLWGRFSVYASRWWEFITADPRESNTEGGVFPAIWGTVMMTLIMSVLVVPFGVLAALYLREYAKAGPVVSAIRISINNLAGVPSIVFGVFGLGLFCYGIGASIDQLFFRAELVDGTPTYGTGGILWASLTLALLTLPVVIVATEESLAAVPNSMREGSYACGASKWQTIRRIVLPRALPGIITGMILAMARGAGEVAPLLLVGVKDLAPALPVDGVFPFVHPQRSFMHLAYQIYIVGFKSPNAEAAKPMVFTMTLLLIAIVALLNIAAVVIRTRLRRRFLLAQF
jgi:phosphate transport system permease protein